MFADGWKKVPLHIFEFEGDRIALDVNRGRPYLIGSTDQAVLSMAEPIRETEAIFRLKEQFSPEAIRASIINLAKRQLLYLPDQPLPPIPVPRDYPEINAIELNISEDCNLRCVYCCVGQGGFGADRGNGRHRNLMTWEIARQSIDMLFDESPSATEVHIRFFGGEPLLNWPVIVQSVHYAEKQADRAEKKVGFSIVINGTLLNENIIQFLHEHHFWVQISIDGTPEMHDACRLDAQGEGSYRRAVAFVPDLLHKLGPENVHARGTITHHVPDMLKAFNHLQELGFRAPELRPVTGHNQVFGLTIQDYHHFNQAADQLAKMALKCDPAQIKHYLSLFWTYITPLMGQSTRRPPCGAGRNMVGISVDGSILPCTDMVGKQHASLQLGDVYSGLRQDKKKEFLEIVEVENKIGCRNCWARYLCGGACASVELGNEGGLDRSAGLECIWIRHVVELSVWLYLKLLAERPAFFYDTFINEHSGEANPLVEALSIG